jgi:PAS domain-containing protein
LSTEKHVALLQQMNQPVPHTVALLLSDAQRRASKKHAKRVANRKSASTSRARKKALVEDMAKANARLKRQAMILSLLPDLVITTTPEGEITFCGAQIERILQYKADDLVGARLYNLVVPSSRDALKCLIDELIQPEKSKVARPAAAKARRSSKRRIDDQRTSSDETGTSKNTEKNVNGNGSARESSRTGGGGASSGRTSGAAVVSEQSFPLSVVEVESKQQERKPKVSATNENLDTSASNSGASGEDDAAAGNSENRKASGDTKKRPRSDDSSSLSSDAKNLRANANLDRNVRWHNQRKKKMLDDGPKDDVTGASVTANNASARLSSLKHVPDTSLGRKKDDKTSRYESTGDQSSSDDSLLAGVEEKKEGENASDDSGYRESNESREETSSDGSDTSQSNGRKFHSIVLFYYPRTVDSLESF